MSAIRYGTGRQRGKTLPVFNVPEARQLQQSEMEEHREETLKESKKKKRDGAREAVGKKRGFPYGVAQ